MAIIYARCSSRFKAPWPTVLEFTWHQTYIRLDWDFCNPRKERLMSLQEKLLRLFSLDQKVRGIQGRLDSATNRLKVQQTKLSQLHQQRDELLSQLKLGQAKASSLEKEVEDIEQRIEHMRQQMQSVKSNKEYSAVLLEANTLKANKDSLETEALEQLNHVESLAQDLNQILERVAQQEKLVTGAQSEVQQCRDEVGKQLEELTAQRSEAEQDVPEEVRLTFNRTAYMHDGATMAPVIEASRRHLEYNCGGCYMTIPVERVNATMVASETQVVCCPNCSRILYIDQELKTSIGCK